MLFGLLSPIANPLIAHRSESPIREASPLPERRTKTQPPPATVHPGPGCHPSTYNWQTHFASWSSYGTGRTGRHFSYKRHLSSYNKSATIPPPLSVHPERRKQVVHPTVRLDVQPAPGVEGHAPQLRHAANNPKLNSYANAASAATHGSPKMCHSYDVGPLPAPRTSPNHPQNPLSQLRHAANNSKLNSYANAAIETTSSYEKMIFSYDAGRTVSGLPARTTIPQLGYETTKSKLNSYARETSKTIVETKSSAHPKHAKPPIQNASHIPPIVVYFT